MMNVVQVNYIYIDKYCNCIECFIIVLTIFEVILKLVVPKLLQVKHILDVMKLYI